MARARRRGRPPPPGLPVPAPRHPRGAARRPLEAALDARPVPRDRARPQHGDRGLRAAGGRGLRHHAPRLRNLRGGRAARGARRGGERPEARPRRAGVARRRAPPLRVWRPGAPPVGVARALLGAAPPAPALRLRYGEPAYDDFPHALWARLLARRVRGCSARELDYAPPGERPSCARPWRATSPARAGWRASPVRWWWSTDPSRPST